jgi:predicted nuclease of predicted toxin-antitoxin system
MIRFLIDAQLPPGLARRLTVRGYEAEHVNRVGLGGKSDIDIWRHATQTRAVLITKDEDFVALANEEASGQVVWIRLGNIGNSALWRALDPQLGESFKHSMPEKESSKLSEPALPLPAWGRRSPRFSPALASRQGRVLWLPSHSG